MLILLQYVNFYNNCIREILHRWEKCVILQDSYIKKKRLIENILQPLHSFLYKPFL